VPLVALIEMVEKNQSSVVTGLYHRLCKFRDAKCYDRAHTKRDALDFMYARIPTLHEFSHSQIKFMRDYVYHKYKKLGDINDEECRIMNMNRSILESVEL
jgi:hypothetical protein